MACLRCGNVTMLPPRRVKQNARFCSLNCYHEFSREQARVRAAVVHLCECGCGERTTPVTKGGRGLQVGDHARHIKGHEQRTRGAKDPAPRFWAKVDKSGDCWIWTAQKSGAGYGMFYMGYLAGKRAWTAHRYSYFLAFGSIPDKLHVCHKCDNPPCVNPAHLFLGTAADNALDCKRKGRVRNGATKKRERLRAHVTETNEAHPLH